MASAKIGLNYPPAATWLSRLMGLGIDRQLGSLVGGRQAVSTLPGHEQSRVEVLRLYQDGVDPAALLDRAQVQPTIAGLELKVCPLDQRPARCSHPRRFEPESRRPINHLPGGELARHSPHDWRAGSIANSANGSGLISDRLPPLL